MATMQNERLIEVDSLTRLYGKLRAVENVSFSLDKGEVLGFLGPNGAGKSTTMQMLCGALAPNQGSIRINDIDLLENPIEAKRAIGFLPEKPPVYPELTVDEYLLYCARLHQIEKKQFNSALDSAKQRCGLTDAGPRLIGNLSKGYRQRVGIAQAIIHSPHVVILDEPTVGLDPIQILEIRNLIKELGQDHGVILSTHILPEVQMTCNRVQIINRGQLVFSDSIDNLNRHMEATTLMLGLLRAPDIAEIKNIEGVSLVETVAKGRFRIHFTVTSPAESLAKTAHENNWGLIELTPESRSLEQIFIELTSTESTAVDEIQEDAA